MLFTTPGAAGEMEYNERLAHFRQGRLNPFDRGEEEGHPEEKTLPRHGECLHSVNPLRLLPSPESVLGCGDGVGTVSPVLV